MQHWSFFVYVRAGDVVTGEDLKRTHGVDNSLATSPVVGRLVCSPPMSGSGRCCTSHHAGCPLPAPPRLPGNAHDG